MRLSGGNDGYVSDWHRLNPDYEGARIHWNAMKLEKAILKYLRELDYRALTENRDKILPEAIRLAEIQTKLDGIVKRTEQLMDSVETCTDKEQRALLMKRLRERAQEKTMLEKEVDKLKTACETAKAAAAGMEDAKAAIAKLEAAMDEDSRLKLRAEIRRLVKRIDAYPHGYDEVGYSSDPYFEITFRDGAKREVSITEGVVFEVDAKTISELAAVVANTPNAPGILAS
jgi:hypothetical protein